MKKFVVGTALVLFAVIAGKAADGKAVAEELFGVPEPAASADMAAARTRTMDAEKRLETLEEAVGVMEERLGRTLKKPTATRNFERRIETLEKTVEKLDRDLKKLETLEREQKKIEERLKKLETARR